MRKKAVEQVDTVFWNVKCDLCGKTDYTPTPQYSFKQCKCCSRDMCPKCSRHNYYWSDDKPDLYCIDCYENGRHFRELIVIEDERHGDAIKDIYKRWYGNAKQYVHDKEKEKDV